jgi:hypothetical protein
MFGIPEAHSSNVRKTANGFRSPLLQENTYMKSKPIWSGIVGVLLLSLAACGEADPVGRTLTVKGKVTVDGKAVNHGGVVFYPDAAKGNASKFECSGNIAEDGSYTLSTRNKPGAPPGAYKVTVVIQAKADSTDPSKAVLEVPKQYTSKEKTPISIEVSEKAAAGAYDLNITK